MELEIQCAKPEGALPSRIHIITGAQGPFHARASYIIMIIRRPFRRGLRTSLPWLPPIRKAIFSGDLDRIEEIYRFVTSNST